MEDTGVHRAAGGRFDQVEALVVGAYGQLARVEDAGVVGIREAAHRQEAVQPPRHLRDVADPRPAGPEGDLRAQRVPRPLLPRRFPYQSGDFGLGLLAHQVAEPPQHRPRLPRPVGHDEPEVAVRQRLGVRRQQVGAHLQRRRGHTARVGQEAHHGVVIVEHDFRGA